MLETPTIHSLYSRGTSKNIEDGFIVKPPFLVVIDAFSAASFPKMKQVIYDKKKSGGEKIKEIIMSAFSSADPSSSLEEILREANRKICAVQKAKGIPTERADLLAGASIIAAKMEEDKIKIVQAGDCRAMWADNSKKVRITENQTYLHDKEARKLIAGFMKKYDGDREKMWTAFYGPLCELRQKNHNQKTKAGFAVLNGQTMVSELWKKTDIPLKDLELLFLISDGMIDFAGRNKDKKIAQAFVMTYMNRGLSGVLEMIRAAHKLTSKKSHIAYPESTAIAAVFEK